VQNGIVLEDKGIQLRQEFNLDHQHFISFVSSHTWEHLQHGVMINNSQTITTDIPSACSLLNGVHDKSNCKHKKTFIKTAHDNHKLFKAIK
jgi:hypothetical protein